MNAHFEHETFPIDSLQSAAKLRRFWEKVEVQGDDECWQWTGATKGKGYGSFWHNGRPARAHRVAWLLARSPIPQGMHVLHHCDNRLCVNPTHLFLGTTEVNNNDMASKLRHGSRKLSREQVLEIRQSRERTGRLAKRFGVGWNVIDKAKRGVTWKHVPLPRDERRSGGFET